MTTDLVGIHPSPPCVVARCRSVQTRSSAVCCRNRRRSLSSLHPACGMVSGCPRQGRSPPARPPHRTKGRGCCRRRRRPRSRWPRRRRRGKTARRARGVSPHDAAVVGGEDREDARAAAAVVEDLDCHFEPQRSLWDLSVRGIRVQESRTRHFLPERLDLHLRLH